MLCNEKPTARFRPWKATSLAHSLPPAVDATKLARVAGRGLAGGGPSAAAAVGLRPGELAVDVDLRLRGSEDHDLSVHGAAGDQLLDRSSGSWQTICTLRPELSLKDPNP